MVQCSYEESLTHLGISSNFSWPKLSSLFFSYQLRRSNILFIHLHVSMLLHTFACVHVNCCRFWQKSCVNLRMCFIGVGKVNMTGRLICRKIFKAIQDFPNMRRIRFILDKHMTTTLCAVLLPACNMPKPHWRWKSHPCLPCSVACRKRMLGSSRDSAQSSQSHAQL